MMKYNFIFGKDKNIDFFGNNSQSTLDIRKEIDNKENLIISYTLNDLPLTKKFIECYQLYRNSKKKLITKNETLDSYDYNWYIPVDQNTIVLAKQEMNKVIDELNSYGYGIDHRLYLDYETSLPEFEKLNDLHYIFERERTVLLDHLDKIRETHLFEKINQLVHFIEKANTVNHQNKQHMLVVRPHHRISYDQLYTKLIDSDYEFFREPESGDLVCDFSTIGKDLWACASTNDLNLIKNNSVRQQEYLTDYVAIIFKNSINRSLTVFKNNFYDWCSANSVDNYFNYQLSKYNPGRHILGKIDSPIKTADDFYENVFSKTPKFLGSFITDDNNLII